MSTTITIEPIDIEFVGLTGFYRPNNQDTTPHQHTRLTMLLYNAGLKLGNEIREIFTTDTLDMYEGVVIENKKAFAQWYSENSGKTYYFKIQ